MILEEVLALRLHYLRALQKKIALRIISFDEALIRRHRLTAYVPGSYLQRFAVWHISLAL